ncbi:MAG: hypothetical protein WDO24_07100 [Pseudomonadota bacterium]
MPADFALAAHGLKPVRLTQRGGAIFGTLHADTPDFASYLGPAIRPLYDRVFDGRALRLLGYSRQRLAANWKLMLENIKDSCHASLLHVFFVTFGLFRADNPAKILMDDSGLHTGLISERGRQELTEDTRQMRAFQADLALKDGRILDAVREFPGDATVIMHTIWPQPDPAAAVEHAGGPADRAARPRRLRAALDVLRLCGRSAGDDPSAGCARPI